MGPAAHPVARFEDQDVEAAGPCRAPCRDASRASADDDHVGAVGMRCHGGEMVGEGRVFIPRCAVEIACEPVESGPLTVIVALLGIEACDGVSVRAARDEERAAYDDL